MNTKNNIVTNNKNEKQLTVTAGQQISGKFTLQNIKHKISQKNKAYVCFDIQTDLLPVRAIAWNESCTGDFSKLHHGQTIEVKGVWKPFCGSMQVHCHQIHTPYNHHQEVENAKRLIREVFDGLSNPMLKTFVARVMNDQSIFDDYITVPASLNHHHSYRGGLFVHSVDVASQLSIQKQIDERVRDIGVVAGLFHDLGKIKTMAADMTRTELGKLVRHEDLTLEILAPHLRWLEQIDTQLSTYLRYVLAWNKKTYGSIPTLDICDAVLAFDRLSASGIIDTNFMIGDCA